MFASTAYQLFPYFMVGYTTALYRISCLPPEEDGKDTQSEQLQFVPSRA